MHPATAVQDRLDDGARRLFGAAGLDTDDRAEALAEVLDELGYRAVQRDPRSLLFDEVVETGEGHPLLLACVAHELARRAGVRSAVFSQPGGWSLGCCGSGGAVTLVPFGGGGRRRDHDATPRRHCAHEVGFAVLLGLENAYDRQGDGRNADRARRLRDHLPLVAPGHAG